MKALFDIVIKQFLTLQIGASLMFLFYKARGKDISRKQILNEIDSETGLKKHAFKASIVGVVFIVTLVLILTTALGMNPKIYNPNN